MFALTASSGLLYCSAVQQLFTVSLSCFCILLQPDTILDEAITDLTKRQLQPSLFRIADKTWIKADLSAIPVSFSCFADCIDFLFMVHYVFNVDYQHELKLILLNVFLDCRNLSAAVSCWPSSFLYLVFVRNYMHTVV